MSLEEKFLTNQQQKEEMINLFFKIRRKKTLLEMLRYMEKDYYINKIDKYLSENGKVELYKPIVQIDYDTYTYETLVKEYSEIKKEIKKKMFFFNKYYSSQKVIVEVDSFDTNTISIFFHLKILEDDYIEKHFKDARRKGYNIYNNRLEIFNNDTYNFSLFPVLKDTMLDDGKNNKQFDFKKEFIYIAQDSDVPCPPASILYKKRLDNIKVKQYSYEFLYVNFLHDLFSKYNDYCSRDYYMYSEDDIIKLAKSINKQIVPVPKKLEKDLKSRLIKKGDKS